MAFFNFSVLWWILLVVCGICFIGAICGIISAPDVWQIGLCFLIPCIAFVVVTLVCHSLYPHKKVTDKFLDTMQSKNAAYYFTDDLILTASATSLSDEDKKLVVTETEDNIKISKKLQGKLVEVRDSGATVVMRFSSNVNNTLVFKHVAGNKYKLELTKSKVVYGGRTYSVNKAPYLCYDIEKAKEVNYSEEDGAW